MKYSFTVIVLLYSIPMPKLMTGLVKSITFSRCDVIVSIVERSAF